MAQIDDPIAIIGLSFQFPKGANDPHSLWEVILRGKSIMTEVPKDRFDVDGYYSSDTSSLQSLPCRGGHFLEEDISKFDAQFFSMNASEAKAMDPTLRLLLETSYCAFENAGVPLDKVWKSNTSVFVGNCSNEYEKIYGRDEEVQNPYQATGVSQTMLSNRLSWFYDLKGPSMSVDTACSSSLIALHLACQSLRSNEANMSLVCGSQLYIDPRGSAIALSNQGFLSPDSVCHSFDERANGYGKGEGIAAIMLKRMSDAIRDGDTIRAVIRGTGANQDGRTPSISQPDATAQAELIRRVYDTYDLDPSLTRYFEAHGTGTAVGDPTEAEAINQVFGQYRSSSDPIYVGALKSNIGHLEAASGLAGVIKAVSVLERGVIPPIGQLKTLNPRIPICEGVKFPTSHVAWHNNGVRRISVNAFGYGGANAHIVIDDALSYMQSIKNIYAHRTSNARIDSPICLLTPPDASVSHSYLFTWSSADEAGISRLALSYDEYLASRTGAPVELLADLAHTLGNKRSVFPWKSFTIASSIDELRSKISQGVPKAIRSAQPPSIQYVFTGQGAQWAQMGRDLMHFPVYQNSIADADSFLQSLGAPWSFLDELEKPEGQTRIHEPALAQPACTILQIALVELLESWSVRPQAVIGHSSGEIAAAFCAGALSRRSAWTVAYYRGEVAANLISQQKDQRGAMMAVALSVENLTQYLEHVQEVSVACMNAPRNTTLSGLEESIDMLKDMFDQQSIFARKLNVPIAYHSQSMSAGAQHYDNALAGKLSSRPMDATLQTPIFYSTVTGRVADLTELLESTYWIQNLVSKVRFRETIQTMHQHLSSDGPAKSKRSLPYWIEIGPHAALERSVKESLESHGTILYDSTLRRNVLGVVRMRELAGQLFTHGCPVKISAVNSEESQHNTPQMLVDLPKYPFNHTQSFWLESKLSKNRRFRNHARHELLGNQSEDWNPKDARWRFSIRTKDLPWVKDHKMDGAQLYPAAGMLVMAIEAARQLCANDASIQGYRLKDVIIANGLIVPDSDDGVEVQLHLATPAGATSMSKLRASWTFRIFIIEAGSPKTICSGQVSVDHSAESKLNSINDREQATTLHHREKYEAAKSKCYKSFPDFPFYNSLERIGAKFGPTFHTLHDIGFEEISGQVTAKVVIGEWQTKISTQMSKNHVIHPTTLDSLLQLPFATLSHDTGLMIPTQLHDVWVSQRLLDLPHETELLLYGSVKLKGIRDTDFVATALDSTTMEPLITMDPFRLTTVRMSSNIGEGSPELRRLCYKIDWRPDFDLLSAAQLMELCRAATRDLLAPDGPMDDSLCAHFLSKALKQVDQQENAHLEYHTQKYIEWARFIISDFEERASVLPQEWRDALKSENESKALVEAYCSGHSTREAFVRFGQSLPDILLGNVNPLHLLFNEGLATTIYQGPIVAFSLRRMAAYIDLVAHKNSNLDILEVGAGTGCATRHILRTLAKQGDLEGTTPRFSSYEFTDISPSFFGDAQTEFAKHADRMTFRTFDVERDPAKQGFEAKYDVIVAASVLHATSDMDTTLSHLRSLLKPGGHLLLSEPSNRRCVSSPFVFGVLPGWWRASEQDRACSPLFERQQWNDVLLRNGFSGNDVFLPDTITEEDHVFSFIASRAQDLPAVAPTKPSLLIVAAESPLQQQIAESLRSTLLSEGFSTCAVVPPTLGDIQDHRDAICISLLELETSFLVSMSLSEYEVLKAIVKISRHLVWITTGGGEAPTRPEADIVAGFGKTMAIENPNLKFTHLNVQEHGSIGNSVLSLLNVSMEALPRDVETEVAEKNGLLYTPRIIEDVQDNEIYETQYRPQNPTSMLLDESTKTPLELKFTPGRLDSFCYAASAQNISPIACGELEIEVKATGINFKDVMVALGQLSDTHIGQEFAGIVTRTGPGTTIQRGSRVCGMINGSFKSNIRLHERNVILIPDAMSYNEASAIPVAFITAHYGLIHLARLQKGETVLIHAAAGAVGQAAIQLALHRKANILVTVSSEAKKNLLIEKYGLEESHFFSSRTLAFADEIMRMTNGRGIDVVLNSLAGEALTETWRCMAPMGRFIEIGKRDINTFSALPMAPFARNVTFASLDIAVIYQHKHELMAQLTSEVERMLFTIPREAIKAPYPVQVFKRSGFEEAFRYLQTGLHCGKAVVDWEEKDTVQVLPQSTLQYKLDENAAYVITGGTGGIGRSYARWMARKGAKNLILLSRTGVQNSAARELVSELTGLGVNVVTPECDVSNREVLSRVLEECQRKMPPVKGCIQSAMFVKNKTFQKMTLEEFNAPLPGKIQGTWNLHDLLPKDMEFFVLLSSLGGMHGASAQCNYAGACSFQDAFARYRHNLGLRCTSLDLGVVSTVGYLAERFDAAQNWTLSFTGHDSLDEGELHHVMEVACASPIPQTSSPWETQVLVAVTTPARVRRCGMLEEHAWMQKPLCRHLYQFEKDPIGTVRKDGSKTSFAGQLKETTSKEEAAEVIVKAVIQRLSRSLSVPEEDIDPQKPAHAFGVDSLVAVELQFWFKNEMKADLTILQILGGTSILELGATAADQSEFCQKRVNKE